MIKNNKQTLSLILILTFLFNISSSQALEVTNTTTNSYSYQKNNTAGQIVTPEEDPVIDGDAINDAMGNVTGGACIFDDGHVVANGSQAVLYKAQVAENCNDISLVRTCEEGELKGDTVYKYWECTDGKELGAKFESASDKLNKQGVNLNNGTKVSIPNTSISSNSNSDTNVSTGKPSKKNPDSNPNSKVQDLLNRYNNGNNRVTDNHPNPNQGEDNQEENNMRNTVEAHVSVNGEEVSVTVEGYNSRGHGRTNNNSDSGNNENRSENNPDNGNPFGGKIRNISFGQERININGEVEVSVNGDEIKINGKPLKVTPNKVRERVKTELENAQITSLELKVDQNGEAYYQVKAQEDGKFLWLFGVDMEVEIKVDIETGEIKVVDKPWYSFLVF